MAKITNAFSIVLTALAVAVVTSAHAAIPVRWTADCYKVKPLVYECYHGETLDLAAEMTAYGDPLDFAGKTARLYWQTNGMEGVWWSTNAAVRADAGVTNVLAAVWSGAYDTGAKSVTGFIGIEGENYRASFTLNFRASPGFSPASLPLPTRTIDWANVQNANAESAPFVVKGGAGGVTLQQVTNVANDRIDAKVAPWAMRGQPQPVGSITDVRTNGVSAVAGGVARIAIPSTNGLASAGDVATAKAQAIATASADATAKADAAEANAKAASRPVDWMPSAENVGALPAAKISSGFYSIEDSFETHENVYMYYGEEEFFNIMYGDYDVRGLLNKPLGKKWYYGGEEDANEIATLGDLPTPATPAFTNAFASKATEGRVTALETEMPTKATYGAVTNGAEAVFVAYADYALTNLTAASLVLASGQIGNYAAPTNFTLALDFPDNGRSGDCLAYIENTNAFDCAVTILPNTYALVSADLAKALTMGKATTNIVSFTRVKANTILVSKLEVK